MEQQLAAARYVLQIALRLFEPEIHIEEPKEKRLWTSR